MNKGELNEAKNIIKQLLPANNTNLVESHKLLRNIGMYQGDAEAIFTSYKFLLESETFDKNIVVEHFIANGILADSVKEIKEALLVYAKRMGKQELACQVDAKVYDSLYDWENALKEWTKHLNQDPDNQAAIYGYAKSLFKLHRFEECFAFLEKELEKDPNSWVVHKFMISYHSCLLYTSPSPRDATLSRMPSSA